MDGENPNNAALTFAWARKHREEKCSISDPNGTTSVLQLSTTAQSAHQGGEGQNSKTSLKSIFLAANIVFLQRKDFRIVGTKTSPGLFFQHWKPQKTPCRQNHKPTHLKIKVRLMPVNYLSNLVASISILLGSFSFQDGKMETWQQLLHLTRKTRKWTTNYMVLDQHQHQRTAPHWIVSSLWQLSTQVQQYFWLTWFHRKGFTLVVQHHRFCAIKRGANQLVEQLWAQVLYTCDWAQRTKPLVLGQLKLLNTNLLVLTRQFQHEKSKQCSPDFRLSTKT